MPSGWQSLSPAQVVNDDDKQSNETLSQNTTGNIVLSFRTPPGLKGFITAFRQAWDSTIVPSFSLRINGAIQANLNALRSQIGAPWDDVDLPTPIPVEQNSLIEVVVDVDEDLADPTATGDFASRVICKYFNPESVK